MTESYSIEFSASVPDGTGRDDPRTVEREIPVNGEITALSVGYPADHDVGLGLALLEGEYLYPRNSQSDYIRYGESGDFPLRRPVSAGETLEARFFNTSGTDYYVPAILGLMIDK